ncbi:Alkaline ceramidase 3 [Geranomyces variabilis]|uniref:Alkaline ceramidase 3 n=1 Tax=Geranomyces variabilis TaxID=109894 RepID=A0AAD5XSI9_9FUNG|nr:Alkaline ceramidase 3 [Geranomyces variabilis]
MAHNHSAGGHGFNITSLFGSSHSTVAIGREGYWGPVTSTLDWCEENYEVLPMIAEMWNASTNIFFLLWPLVGIYSAYKTNSERGYYASYAALMLVGCGSFLFHGTLTYTMQLLDELPMMLATCIFVYTHIQMFATRPSPKTMLAMAAVFLAVTASYLFLQTPILFQLAFIALTLIQVGLGIHNIYKLSRTHKHESRVLYTMIATSVGAILFAFTLWNVDQVHCGALQGTRNAIGYPLRVGLELHAWWHVLSGFAGYVGVVGAQYCRLLALGRTDVRVAVWAGVLPVLVVVAGGASQDDRGTGKHVAATTTRSRTMKSKRA